ncbi:hypothetical protein T440DRAFT_266962 [Plenodomus tracheiphilus IPT5]|uniref:Uncharacterized protein n=1 Tax=Plenodomus tracheiphilus IPT5 TaxID=1408161 RepID=A0A6A7BHV6_9PLEO|nr:hypothetical protein T440DRAFT_266962 [Plenodomus tracheiphilus IPT5]
MSVHKKMSPDSGAATPQFKGPGPEVPSIHCHGIPEAEGGRSDPSAPACTQYMATLGSEGTNANRNVPTALCEHVDVGRDCVPGGRAGMTGSKNKTRHSYRRKSNKCATAVSHGPDFFVSLGGPNDLDRWIVGDLSSSRTTASLESGHDLQQGMMRLFHGCQAVMCRPPEARGCRTTSATPQQRMARRGGGLMRPRIGAVANTRCTDECARPIAMTPSRRSPSEGRCKCWGRNFFFVVPPEAVLWRACSGPVCAYRCRDTAQRTCVRAGGDLCVAPRPTQERSPAGATATATAPGTPDKRSVPRGLDPPGEAQAAIGGELIGVPKAGLRCPRVLAIRRDARSKGALPWLDGALERRSIRALGQEHAQRVAEFLLGCARREGEAAGWSRDEGANRTLKHAISAGCTAQRERRRNSRPRTSTGGPWREDADRSGYCVEARQLVSHEECQAGRQAGQPGTVPVRGIAGVTYQ